MYAYTYTYIPPDIHCYTYIATYTYVIAMQTREGALPYMLYAPAQPRHICMHESKGVQCPKVSANIPVSGNP